MSIASISLLPCPFPDPFVPDLSQIHDLFFIFVAHIYIRTQPVESDCLGFLIYTCVQWSMTLIGLVNKSLNNQRRKGAAIVTSYLSESPNGESRAPVIYHLLLITSSLPPVLSLPVSCLRRPPDFWFPGKLSLSEHKQNITTVQGWALEKARISRQLLTTCSSSSGSKQGY